MASSETASRLIFAGTAIALTLYGVFVTLSFICLHYLLSNRNKNWVVLVYTFSSLAASTLFVVGSTKATELLFIETVFNGPAPAAGLLRRLDLLERVSYSMVVWLADSLLIYRLWVVWGGDFLVVIVPCLLLLGAIAAGIAGVALFWHTDKAQTIVDLGVGFHACTVALNVIATILIAGRLVRHRRFLRNLGSGDHGRHYLSLMAVFAESGALYSIAGIIYIPMYATNSPYVYVFAPILEAAACIAPSLILLRISLGVAVEMSSKTPQITSLNFGLKRDYLTTFTETTFDPYNSTGSQRTCVNNSPGSIAGDSPNTIVGYSLGDHVPADMELHSSIGKAQ